MTVISGTSSVGREGKMKMMPMWPLRRSFGGGHRQFLGHGFRVLPEAHPTASPLLRAEHIKFKIENRKGYIFTRKYRIIISVTAPNIYKLYKIHHTLCFILFLSHGTRRSRLRGTSQPLTRQKTGRREWKAGGCVTFCLFHFSVSPLHLTSI